ncbi:MAG: hypothetical protein ACK4K0_06905 [Flavobacteriales bacterium]
MVIEKILATFSSEKKTSCLIPEGRLLDRKKKGIFPFIITLFCSVMLYGVSAQHNSCSSALPITPKTNIDMDTATFLSAAEVFWFTFQGIDDDLAFYVDTSGSSQPASIITLYLYSSPSGCGSLTIEDSTQYNGGLQVFELNNLTSSSQYFIKVVRSNLSRIFPEANFQYRLNIASVTSCITITRLCDNTQETQECCCVTTTGAAGITNPCPGSCNATHINDGGCMFDNYCLNQAYSFGNFTLCNVGTPGMIIYTMLLPDGSTVNITSGTSYNFIMIGLHTIIDPAQPSESLWTFNVVECDNPCPPQSSINCDTYCLNFTSPINNSGIPSLSNDFNLYLFTPNINGTQIDQILDINSFGVYCFENLAAGNYGVILVGNAGLGFFRKLYHNSALFAYY